MRYLFKPIFFIIVLCSCEVGKPNPEADQLFTYEFPEEFFRVVIDGQEMIITDDPTKASSGRALAAESYEWIDAYGQRKLALKFWGTKEGRNGEEIQKVGGLVKDYEGPGTYFTGTDQNANFCHYLYSGKSYMSDSYKGETGFIDITRDVDGWVTGNFDFRAYNINDPEDSKRLTGLFKVLKENSD